MCPQVWPTELEMPTSPPLPHTYELIPKHVWLCCLDSLNGVSQRCREPSRGWAGKACFGALELTLRLLQSWEHLGDTQVLISSDNTQCSPQLGHRNLNRSYINSLIESREGGPQCRFWVRLDSLLFAPSLVFTPALWSLCSLWRRPSISHTGRSPKCHSLVDS